LQALTTGSVYLFNENLSSTTSISNGFNGANFYLLNNGSLSITGNISASSNIAIESVGGTLAVKDLIAGGQVAVSTSDSTDGQTNLNLTANGNISAGSSLFMTTASSGSISFGSGVHVGAGSVVIGTTTLNLPLNLTATSGDITIGGIGTDGSIAVNLTN